MTRQTVQIESVEHRIGLVILLGNIGFLLANELHFFSFSFC